jgi:hypothetical protein
MKIECTLRREEPVVVPIGNEVYRFEPDAEGRRVCEVWLESHVEAFLAVPHLYREAAPLADVAPAEPQPEPTPRPGPKPRPRPANRTAATLP